MTVLIVLFSSYAAAAPSCGTWYTDAHSTDAGPGVASKIFFEEREHGKSCTTLPAVAPAEVEIKCTGNGDPGDEYRLYLQTFPGGSTTGWDDPDVTIGDNCGRYGCDNYDVKYTASGHDSEIYKTIDLPKTSGQDEIQDTYAYCWVKENDDGWAWSTSSWASYNNGDIDEPPNAAFTYSPSNPGIGESVSFSSSGTTDPDGDFMRYKWDFGDGSSLDYDSETEVSHSYSSPGSYTVTMTARDDANIQGSYDQTDSASKTVSVTDQTAPTTIGSPTYGSTTGTDPLIEGYLEDNYQLSSYTLEIDGNSVSSGSISGTDSTQDYQANSLSEGDHTYTWTVEDGAGNQVSDQYSFTVDPNNDPTADIYLESTVCAEDSVYMNGYSSSDSDGSISSYEWDVDNDGVYEQSGDYNYNSYGSEGTYTVTLRVTDNDGATDTASDTVDYDYSYCNDPPNAAIDIELPVSIDESVNVDAYQSSDPDGSINSYEWDTDDDGSYDDGTGETIYPSYGSPGNYQIGLKVTDNDGATDYDSGTVDVNDNTNPDIDSSTPTGSTTNQNPDITGDFSDNYDLDTYNLDIDGNQVSSGNIYGTSDSVTYSTSGLSSGSHSYTWTVEDSSGNTQSTQINFNSNRDPSASFISNSPVLTGEDFGIDASGSSDPDGDSLTYEWDLDNDGSYDDATGVTPSYSETDDGSYNVGLRVSDGNGGTDTTSTTVTVENRNPSASFSFSPLNPGVDELVSFDGSGSSDQDGSISSYGWDWTNDGTFEETGQTPINSFSDTGDYSVELRVTDDGGDVDTFSDTVSVTDQTDPTITNLNPTETVSNRYPTVSADFQDNYQLGSYSLDLDGNQVSSGTLTGSSNSANYNADSLSPGSHDYTWTVLDSSGNQVTKQEIFTVSILESQSNTNTVEGGLWVQSGSLRWGDGSKEYWIQDADIFNSDSSGPEGSIWVQGQAIHWIDGGGDERTYEGSEVAVNVVGQKGFLWTQNNLIHYIDQDSDERVLDGK